LFTPSVATVGVPTFVSFEPARERPVLKMLVEDQVLAPFRRPRFVERRLSGGF